MVGAISSRTIPRSLKAPCALGACRRPHEIVKAIDQRFELLAARRQDLDQAARAFCDLLSDGSHMGRGAATQIMAGISMGDGPLADLLSHTRNHRERIRSGLEPVPAPAPASPPQANE